MIDASHEKYSSKHVFRHPLSLITEAKQFSQKVNFEQGLELLETAAFLEIKIVEQGDVIIITPVYNYKSKIKAWSKSKLNFNHS